MLRGANWIKIVAVGPQYYEILDHIKLLMAILSNNFPVFALTYPSSDLHTQGVCNQGANLRALRK